MILRQQEISVIEVSNDNTYFYVIGAEVKISKNKNKSFVVINGKKIYGLSRVEYKGKIIVNDKGEIELI